MDLRFSCQPGCTACCRQQGFVYLTGADVERAAAFLEISPAAFEQRYVYRTANLRRLRKPRDRQCPFLLESGCGIHPAKPTQCRTYPFWPELIENGNSWRAAAGTCPGIGKGRTVAPDLVYRISLEMATAYPFMYKNRKGKEAEKTISPARISCGS